MKNPPIALQLSHPDAFFYEVSADSKTVSGLFEAHDKGQPFEISVRSFVGSAYTLDYIDDYELQSGRVFVGDSSGGKDYPLDGWLADFIERGNGLQAVLRHAAESEFETEIDRLYTILRSRTTLLLIPRRLSRLSRSVDTDFCDAVTELAGIIQSIKEYEDAVADANPKKATAK